MSKSNSKECPNGGRSPFGSSNLLPCKTLTTTENHISKCAFHELCKWFEELCDFLPQKKLYKLRQIIRKAEVRRFESKKHNLSKNLNRTFSEEELRKFFEALPDERYRLIFIVQLALALRIGEISRLKISQIDFSRGAILIHEEKTKSMIEKHVPAEVWERLINYISVNKLNIVKTGLVWDHSKDWLRNLFRKTLKKAGLARVYAISQTGSSLYVLSTHSFRRTGITKMAKALNGDPFKLKLYSGHKSTSSLEKYVQLENKGEIDSISDHVFGSKGRVNELKRYFEKG